LQSTEPSDVGPEYRDCPACGKSIRTGQSEWVEMSVSDKREHIRKVIFQNIFSSIIFCGFGPAAILYAITIEFLELGWSDNVFIIIGIIGTVIGLSLSAYGVIDEIIESRARTSTIRIDKVSNED
jgi:hypothetical protein